MAKATNKIKITDAEIRTAYIDYVLTHNEAPKTVYSFTKDLGIEEADFYDHFSSFEGIESSVWSSGLLTTINKIQEQEIWEQFSAREKMLSFFYGYIEMLKQQRSFIIYSLKKCKFSPVTPEPLREARKIFEAFAEQIINEGLESGELADRKFFSKRYKDALWVQYGFILKFWEKDMSPGFEKTDEAIERGVQVSFDLFQHSPLDNLFDYGKFLARNAKFN